MPRPASSQPTEVELQILQVLWEHGASTARQIHNWLMKDRDTNYSVSYTHLTLPTKA